MLKTVVISCLFLVSHGIHIDTVFYGDMTETSFCKSRCNHVGKCIVINMRTVSFYECRCNDGFEHKDFMCIDINECLPNQRTCDKNALCNNKYGGYNCTCKAGFTGNGKDCTDIDECANGRNKCHKDAVCTNTDGSYYCSCKNGYYGDGWNCTDLDECATGKDICNRTISTCDNLNGTYKCNCNTGYQHSISNSPFVCENINECIGEDHGCHKHGECLDKDGSHSCVCKAGFTGDGKNCSDVDECELNIHSCSNLSNCVDTFEGYFCECMTGYRRSKNKYLPVCENVNECENNNMYKCPPNSDCVDTPGSYNCICRSGYFMKDGYCQDINECDLIPPACNGTISACNNIVGGFVCECKAGYENEINNRTICKDIDECRAGTHSCDQHAHCENENGTFKCRCAYGFTGNGSIGQCEEDKRKGELEKTLTEQRIEIAKVRALALELEIKQLERLYEYIKRLCDKKDAINSKVQIIGRRRRSEELYKDLNLKLGSLGQKKVKLEYEINTLKQGCALRENIDYVIG